MITGDAGERLSPPPPPRPLNPRQFWVLNRVNAVLEVYRQYE